MSVLLRIEHPVPDFAGWKRAFDSDPAGRRASGVRSHRVLRPIDNPNYALIDLEFATKAEAQAFQKVLEGLWRRVEGQVMTSPQARIVEIVETVEYA